MFLRNILPALMTAVIFLLFCPPSLAGTDDKDGAFLAGVVVFELIKIILLFAAFRFLISLFVSTPQN